MTSEPGSAAVSGQDQDSVVLASFESYRDAEHMVASLGREFRKTARKGGARAVVVRGNADGSLKTTESRVLEAGDLTAALMHISLSWVVGFLGTFSMLKGARSGARAAQAHGGHVGSEEHRAHEILADAGPHAAVLLVRCKDQQTRQMVAAAAAKSQAARLVVTGQIIADLVILGLAIKVIVGAVSRRRQPADIGGAQPSQEIATSRNNPAGHDP
jgi:hypothetical protein